MVIEITKQIAPILDDRIEDEVALRNGEGGEQTMADVKVYGAPWCPDCRRSKQFFAEMRIPYDWIDIAQDEDGVRVVNEKNAGQQILPPILFDDGSFLT